MRRLLTSFIALAAMLTTSVEVKAWDAVAFRSTLDSNWDASTTGGNTMTKVNDNEFYIDITTNGDVSFRFYVSDGQEWLIPNDGNGTVATHNTEVWGNSGNSSTNDCFKLVPGTYNSFRIHLYYKNQGGDGKRYWTVKAEPNGGGGGGTSDEAYYLVSPSINGGAMCEYLKFYPSRNRTKDGYDGKTDYRYWTLNFKYDDIKKIAPNAPETFNYYIVDQNGNAVCRPYDNNNNYQLGKNGGYKYCDTKQDNDVTSRGHVQYETYDDTKTHVGGSNTFQMSTAWGKSFTLFFDKEGTRPLTMNINKSFTEDDNKKYYLIGNINSAVAGDDWSPLSNTERILMQRKEYNDSIVYTATVKRPANGWKDIYMGVCPYYLIEDGVFNDWDWQHIYRPQVDPVIINNIGSKDGVAPHGGLAIPGSGEPSKYDYSSLNPPIDDDVESFIFSMNITTATYRIDYIHDLYIIGDAVQSGEPVSEWSGGKAQVLEYDANLGYWSANVTMNNGGYFRFANDKKMSSSFGENGHKPGAPDSQTAAVNLDGEPETQYVNKVAFYSEETANHTEAMNRNDITFWLESGTYTIKFYAQAENNGTAVDNDFARTYYVIEPKFIFHAPVNRNNENLSTFTHFKAFSSAHTMNKPEGVTMYTAAVKEGTEGKKVTITELTGDLIPANTGVLLATYMPGATSAQEIDFTTATNPWETIVVNQRNDLVPHLIKGTIYSTSDNGYNYIFGYRALKTTPSGKVTLGFFKPTGSNLPANSAYLYSRYNVTTDAQGFAIFFDDDDTTTAIDAVESAATADDNAPYYSLQGVRYAGKPAAGIYIHNGKKVIIK